MAAKIIKDKNIPRTFKRAVTKLHKYILSEYGYTSNKTYEVYHSDDCTLNNMVFLFEVQGSLKTALLQIGVYEAEQEQIKNNLLIL